MSKYFTYTDFIKESNRIEDIHREPTEAEIAEFTRFMALKKVTLDDVIQFVSVYQPNATLRDQPGMNVQVGDHIAPSGGIDIKTRLMDIIEDANLYCRNQEQAYFIHHRYERLHPFMDGNGRSGRMLWAWMMQNTSRGFLHIWYYQTLQYSRK